MSLLRPVDSASELEAECALALARMHQGPWCPLSAMGCLHMRTPPTTLAETQRCCSRKFATMHDLRAHAAAETEHAHHAVMRAIDSLQSAQARVGRAATVSSSACMWPTLNAPPMPTTDQLQWLCVSLNLRGRVPRRWTRTAFARRQESRRAALCRLQTRLAAVAESGVPSVHAEAMQSVLWSLTLDEVLTLRCASSAHCWLVDATPVGCMLCIAAVPSQQGAFWRSLLCAALAPPWEGTPIAQQLVCHLGWHLPAVW